MRRRELIRGALAGSAALLVSREAEGQKQVAAAARGMASPIIKDISVLACAPQGVRLVIVKVTTDQAGLYGYGCATFTQRADLIPIAVEKYLKPLLVGRPADRIEDTWHLCYNSSYWRNSGVLNNAISGVDQALWDIKGRQAGLPVYQLLGGKARLAADCYAHASGSEIPEVIESAKRWMAQGFRHIRIQVGVPGMSGYGSGANKAKRYPALHDAPVFERESYIRRALALFEACRKQLGMEVQLLHDTHERITPTQAVKFCKDVEQFRLFFLEDPVSPEDIQWFRNIRAQCATPLAMGELFNSPHEVVPLIAERLIDYMRMHVSQMGGLTPCRKYAAMGEIFNVRTAWHGPADTSPVGHAANLALDLACTNFGVQENALFNEATHEIFSGLPVTKGGYMYANEAPGWGIEINETALAKYPWDRTHRLNGGWGEVRLPDGQIIKQ
ncbi:MAG TPA: enolase C-terminal domain-like protein [Polyangia bacterium]